MCFIIALIALGLSYGFYNADNLFAAIASFLIATLFIYFMAKNIKYVKSLKNKERKINDN
jgi:uncharacterized membrane-anchored protein YitT (DUF2179 family)